MVNIGQYFLVYAKAKDSNKPVVYDIAHMTEFGGLKLTEQSWIGHEGVESVMRMLYEKGPHIIIWMGDYADDDPKLNSLKTDTENPYCIVWKERNKYEGRLECNPLSVTDNQYFILNHTKKEFLDVKKFVEMNTGEYGCLHPLPLLTALGNGEGGGDYFGINEDKIGCWAGHLIEVTNTSPDGYSELIVEFVEE